MSSNWFFNLLNWRCGSSPQDSPPSENLNEEDSTEERLSQEKARRRERRNQQRQRAEERLEQLQRKLSSDYNNQMEEQEKLKTAHLRFAEMVKCHLKCGICLELYSDPINAPCGHAFCSQCIKDFFEKSPDDAFSTFFKLPCPECRTKTRTFYSNYDLGNVVEIFQVYYPDKEPEIHRSAGRPRAHTTTRPKRTSSMPSKRTS